MDVDFIVQDTFALVRPQWKLSTNLDEAGRSFADAVAQNYRPQDSGKAVEPDESVEDTSSEDAAEEDDLRVPEADVEGQQSSSEEIEEEVCLISPTLPFWESCLTPRYRLKPTEPIKVLGQIPTMRRLSSLFRKKIGIPRLMLNLIANSRS